MFCIQSFKGSRRGKQVLYCNVNPSIFQNIPVSDSCLCLGYWFEKLLDNFMLLWLPLLPSNCGRKIFFFTKAIASLIWVSWKGLVKRTETLFVMFRLPREFFYGHSGFPLSWKKKYYISVRFVSSLNRAKVQDPGRHTPIHHLWGVPPPPEDPECGRRRSTSWIKCDPTELKLIDRLINWLTYLYIYSFMYLIYLPIKTNLQVYR